MAAEQIIRWYRTWYARLLRLYPRRYHERFGESMEQTFHDLLREHSASRRIPFAFALWVFGETFTGIIRENWAIMKMKSVARVSIVTAILLLIPLTAMRFSNEVNWTLLDFLAAGMMLFSAGMAFELMASRSRNLVYRAAAALGVGSALFLLWANLAVGIIGNEDNHANWMYMGVLAVAAVGAAIARFQPRGMARALFATAAAQMLTAAIALMAGLQHAPESSTREILGVNAFFASLFVASALLFQRASSGDRA